MFFLDEESPRTALSNMIATNYIWPFKLKIKSEFFTHTLATFQVLSLRMWLVATILESKNISIMAGENDFKNNTIHM